MRFKQNTLLFYIVTSATYMTVRHKPNFFLFGKWPSRSAKDPELVVTKDWQKWQNKRKIIIIRPPRIPPKTARNHFVNCKRNCRTSKGKTHLPTFELQRPRPGSVVVERSPGMWEVGGSIPGRVKQKTLKFEVLLLCLAHSTKELETVWAARVRIMVWVGTSLLTRGVVFQWASTV